MKSLLTIFSKYSHLAQQAKLMNSTSPRTAATDPFPKPWNRSQDNNIVMKCTPGYSNTQNLQNPGGLAYTLGLISKTFLHPAFDTV